MANPNNPKSNTPDNSHRPPIGKYGSALSIEALQNESSKIFNDNKAEILRLTEGQFTAGKINETEDAFRHAYSNAVVAQNLGKTPVPGIVFSTEALDKGRLETGIAVTRAVGAGFEGMSVMHHGRADLNQGDVGMDLHNNEVGYRVARAAGPGASREQLRDLVLAEMGKGNLILSNRDPRAQEVFDKSIEMRSLQALRDGGVYVGEKAVEAKTAVVDAATLAYDKSNAALEATAKSLKEFGAQTKEFAHSTATAVKEGVTTAHQAAVSKTTDMMERYAATTKPPAHTQTAENDKEVLNKLSLSAPPAERTGGLGMTAPKLEALATNSQHRQKATEVTAENNRTSISAQSVQGVRAMSQESKVASDMSEQLNGSVSRGFKQVNSDQRAFAGNANSESSSARQEHGAQTARDPGGHAVQQESQRAKAQAAQQQIEASME